VRNKEKMLKKNVAMVLSGERGAKKKELRDELGKSSSWLTTYL